MRTLLIVMLVCLSGCGDNGEIDLRNPVFPPTFPDPASPCSLIEWKTNNLPGLNGVITMTEDIFPNEPGLQFYISARYSVPASVVAFQLNREAVVTTNRGEWFTVLVDVGVQRGMLSILTTGQKPTLGCPFTLDYIKID